MRKQRRVILLWLTGLVWIPGLALAQTDTGRISGTVRDQTNTFVADAAVTAKNEKTGETRSTTSNQEGFLSSLP
jgi:hypothetical protein